MAAALMSAWHANPVVNRLAPECGHGRGDREGSHDGDRIWKNRPNGLKWTQLDEALPLPLDFNNAMVPMLVKISTIAQIDQ